MCEKREQKAALFMTEEEAQIAKRGLLRLLDDEYRTGTRATIQYLIGKIETMCRFYDTKKDHRGGIKS